MTIRNPIEWTADKVGLVAHQQPTRMPKANLSGMYRGEQSIVVQKIELHDLRDALSKGYQDFAANRTDVIFLCLMYQNPVKARVKDLFRLAGILRI